MGFRIDGCGTYDNSKVLKYVGDFKCDTCNAVYPFHVYELIEKITVLYIPVAKISTRYALLCSHCKNGYKLEEEQKNRVMSGDMGFLVKQLTVVETDNPENSVYEEQPKSHLNIPAAVSPATSTGSAGCCLRCGAQINADNYFCFRCGLKYPSRENNAMPATPAKVCAKCGHALEEDMLFCTKCGNKIN